MIEDTKATELLQAHYGLDGKLTRLGGDRDANFMAELENGQRYVFKIMHPHCPPESVELQCAALQHLSHSRLRLPTVITSCAGKCWETVNDNGTSRIIWLLSWCSGTLLAEYSPHSDALFASFGETLAKLDNALEGFSQPAMAVGSRWNLTQAMESADLVEDIPGETRDIARGIFERFASHTSHALATLPHGMIHNDANDYNVLVNTVNGTAVVDGLFDFGDIAWQPVICDIAIALAYLIMDKKEPLAVCSGFLSGYSAHRALAAEELAVLLELIRTRLAVSIAISSHRVLSEPDDPYITISQQPAIRSLKKLQAISRDEAEYCFRKACLSG